MTFYQELQLNQAGSKSLIKGTKNQKEKIRHILTYLLKVCLSVSFCTLFVTAYSMIFGTENSIVGVVILLCVLSFRFTDFGIKTSDAMKILPLIFAILAFGPRLANAYGPVFACIINMICILALLVLGCHNVIYFNHFTLVLGYLLLYGYDVTGKTYLTRLFAMGIGLIITMVVYYRNHRKQTYKRNLKDLFAEFHTSALRTRWQIKMSIAISTAMLFATLLHFPRCMWVGIAVMSVTMPFQREIHERSKGRIWGNIVGAVLFIAIYYLLPKPLHSIIGILGGIGVGFSATYKWQAVFNSLGAMSVAVSYIGFPNAVIFRVINNAFGALYGLLFEKLCSIRLRVPAVS